MLNLKLSPRASALNEKFRASRKQQSKKTRQLQLATLTNTVISRQGSPAENPIITE